MRRFILFPGYVSIRNTVEGSWFIKALVGIFSKYACQDDIFGLVTKVCFMFLLWTFFFSDVGRRGTAFTELACLVL